MKPLSGAAGGPAETTMSAGRVLRWSSSSRRSTHVCMDARSYHSSAKTSRSLSSCSADRLLAMSSALPAFGNSPLIRSITASEVSRKSADVPGVTRSFTELMKPSSMPTSVSEPDGRSEQWYEEDQPEEHAPEGASESADRSQVAQLSSFGLLLADLPGHHGGVLNVDQLLGLQCAKPLCCLIGISDPWESPCGECGHRGDVLLFRVRMDRCVLLVSRIMPTCPVRLTRGG